jgi:hypothetical protein
VRFTISIVALCAAAILATPASAADWRAEADAGCSDYYDGLSLAAGRLGEGSDITPEFARSVAHLTDVRDARLARVRPPARHAAALGRLLARDRDAAAAMHGAARALAAGGAIGRLLERYDHDQAAVIRTARALKLDACAGRGVVRGPAVEL